LLPERGLTIEWREGNAEQLPFHANAFDLVLSQFALMFVADKAAALSEMRRVAHGSGRVLISVWQGLDRHPFYQTLHNVIQQRLGMSALQEIFALGDADALRGLALAAGRLVEIKPFSLTARFPNPDAFIAGGNRGRYRCDSFDAAPRFSSSGSNRQSDHQRYGVAVKRADI
jgi:SAM-dependent methyltransferase